MKAVEGTLPQLRSESPGVAWICCQVGAREHFAVPRAVHAAGRLAQLITDRWTPPGRAVPLPRQLRDRYHPDLASARVTAFNGPALAFEAANRLRKAGAWEAIIRRNDWFQAQALKKLAEWETLSPGEPCCLFAFSYAARSLLQFAKDRGWSTVLGQIDPAVAEERLVGDLHERHAQLAGPWSPAPPEYWDRWREECRLADVIMVNSPWSAKGLAQEGVSAEKVRVVPLAFEPPEGASRFRRAYPDRFTPGRPLRVLFLGQLALRKGMAEILEAMQAMRGLPVEFTFVGPRLMSLPSGHVEIGNARWVGPVARAEASAWYRESDVFLFPTHSDGFGITQLEARAWRLPVIASRNCGEVVRHGVDGVVLDEVSGAAIARALRGFLDEPARAAAMSAAIPPTSPFGIERLQAELLAIMPSVHGPAAP